MSYFPTKSRMFSHFIATLKWTYFTVLSLTLGVSYFLDLIQAMKTTVYALTAQVPPPIQACIISRTVSLDQGVSPCEKEKEEV